MHLTIKGHDSGLGLYLGHKPWRFYKSGDDVAILIIDLLTKGATAAHYAGPLSDKDLERHFT